MTVYLVRHAKYANPREILPGRLAVMLSPEGVAQADRLKLYFKEKNIQKIFSSPVKRCMQTSEIISDGSIGIEGDLRLAETFSAAQGSKDTNDWRYVLYADAKALGGESSKQVQDRMIDFWEELISNENLGKDQGIVVCSHGDPLFFLYQYLFGQNAWSDLSINEPPGYQSKASIRQVNIDSGGQVAVDKIIFP